MMEYKGYFAKVEIVMKDEFDQFTGFQWDEGNINKNLYKHKVENWECEQAYFNEPLIILDDPKHSILILA